MQRERFVRTARVVALALAVAPLAGGTASAVTVDLVAQSFQKTLGGVPVTMWGFALQGGGPAAVPGPRIVVPPGDTSLTINLTNNLPVPISIVIPGQTAALDPVRFTDGRGRDRVSSFAAETAANGGTGTYTWSGLKPGTYLYHSGTHPAVQVQMGLYGALTANSGAGEAYPGRSYDTDVLLVYSEVDPTLHAAVANGSYGTPPGPTSTLNYKPQYFLVNGNPFTAGQAGFPAAGVGQNTLLRFVNAGLVTHVPLLQGGHMSLIAEDGNPYPLPRAQYTAMLPAGKTTDAIFTPDATGTYPLYDRALHLTTGGQPGGGMLSYLQVGAAAPNSPPVATNGAATVLEDALNAPITLAASDPDVGDTLTYTIVTPPSNGALSNGTGPSRTYTPAPNYFGADSFTFSATDNHGAPSNLATVSITVTPVNDPPTFVKSSDQTVPTTAGPQSVPGWATFSPGPANEGGQTVSFVLSNNNSGLFTAQPAVDGTGTLTYTPSGAAGAATVTIYAVDNGGGSNQSPSQTFTITVQAPGGSPVLLYFSTQGNTTVPGVAAPYDNADVYTWNGATFGRLFDATVAGLPGGADLDGLVVAGTSLYLSFKANGGTAVPGVVGLVQDEDIVRYDIPTGAFSLYFDGSAVGLGDTNDEDVDAFDILADGSLVVSTLGNNTVPGLAGINLDEDLIQCVGTFPNPASCTWSVYFDGSDVALAAGSEDLDGASVTASGIHLSTTGTFSVTGLTGVGGDVFRCVSPTTGPATGCGSFASYFSAAAAGLTDNIDAIYVPDTP